MERRNHLPVDELVGRGRGKLLAGDEFAQIDRVILGQQQNHILTGAQNQNPNRRLIRRSCRQQRFRRFGMRTKIMADKIGNPLGAGEIEIVLGTKIVGDRRDILPGLRGNIAGGGVQAVFAELGDGCGNELAFGLFAFGCHRSRRHRTIKINQSID